MAKSVCVLAGRECPRTGDINAKSYCPAWVCVVENEKDGSGRLISTQIYTGCAIPKILPYMVGVTAEVDHAHAAANQARDAALETGARLISSENALRGALLAPLLQSFGRMETVVIGDGRGDKEESRLLLSDVDQGQLDSEVVNFDGAAD